jgi:hypothetical protein|tara:strand:- start:399 stop:512 length:114 start_codon:yes stop_codon:yes gene_type:complete
MEIILSGPPAEFNNPWIERCFSRENVKDWFDLKTGAG